MFGDNPIEDAWLKTAALMSFAMREQDVTGNEMRMMRRVLEPLVEATSRMFPSETMGSIEHWVKTGPNDHGRFRSSAIIRKNREYEAQGLDPHTDENSEKIWAEAEKIADEKFKELQEKAEAEKPGLAEWFATMRITVKCEKCGLVRPFGEGGLLLTAFEKGQKWCVECQNEKYRQEHGGKDAWTALREE